jgi:hypothetical protein
VTLVALPSPAVFNYSHKGDYSESSGNGPVITVEFAMTDPDGFLLGADRTGVVVDSGADVTMLNYRVAEALGLDLTDEERYPRQRAIGIAGGVPCAGAWILADLCDRWFEIPVMFAMPGYNVRNLLGRRGVFDRIQFAFGHADEAVYCAQVSS